MKRFRREAKLAAGAALLWGWVCVGAAPAGAAEGQEGPDTGTGCMALGQGPTVAEGICRYIAVSDTQNVIAVVGSEWDITVTRCCTGDDCVPVLSEDGVTPPDLLALNCKPGTRSPRTFYLMSDDGSSYIVTGQVHPIPREYVTVNMYTGAVGFISVGQDEAIVPGGLPLFE
ncbi:MAG: hypothetical protein ACREQY_09155 [Candidatus Binatia bacterium]